MTKDVQEFFKCFLVIRNSSVENSLFNSVPHFSVGLFNLLVFNFLNSIYILGISLLSDVVVVKIFS